MLWAGQCESEIRWMLVMMVVGGDGGWSWWVVMVGGDGGW